MPDSILDWDVLRVFLATMRTSNLRDAADRLGVSHPTVRRKLDQLEAQLGVVLFERHPKGLRATAAAAELLRAAETVEADVHALRRRASAMSPELDGEIRISVPDLVASLLMPDLASFATRWPQVQLRIEPSYALANLGRREADVAIRAMPHGQAPDGDLIGRLGGTVYSAVYGRDHQWIGWWGDERDRAMIDETPFADRPVALVLPDAGLQLAACRAGLGLSALACFQADPVLDRHTEPRPARDLWVLVHPDLRRAPRVRLFRDAMVEALERHRPRLEGAAP